MLIKKIFTLFVVLFSMTLMVEAQTPPVDKKARQWFKRKEWAGGWNIRPHKTTDYQEFYRQYSANKETWDKAFAFLKNTDLKTLAAGKHAIDGELVFASVTENPSKDFDSTSWESHKKYIDLQYVIEGEELIGIHPAAKATVTKGYDARKDVMNYTVVGKAFSATPDTFFLFFPSDAHRPNITPGGNKVVKKIVIKIKVA